MKGMDVKFTLKRHGVTLKKVAAAIGESQQNLTSLLSKDDIRSSLLERISEATGISIEEFYGMTPGEAPAPPDPHDKYITALSDQQAMTRQALDQVDTLLRILDTKLDMMKQ